MLAYDDNAPRHPLGPRQRQAVVAPKPVVGSTLADSLGMKGDAKAHGHLGGLLSGKLGVNRYEVSHFRRSACVLLRADRGRSITDVLLVHVNPPFDSRLPWLHQQAGYAPDSRSKCYDARCKDTIVAGSLRMGKRPPAVKSVLVVDRQLSLSITDN